MCEIYTITDPQGLSKGALREVYEKAVLPSASCNPHGFGFFTEGGEYWKIGCEAKPKYLAEVIKRCEGKRFAVFHTRFATQGGRKSDDSHPFSNGNLMLVHNGVLNCPGSRDRVDSDLFLEQVSLGIGKGMEAAVRNALRKCTGWASVVLYDDAEQAMYYFRTGRPTFTWARLGLALIGGTKVDRLREIGLDGEGGFFSDRKLYRDPEHDILYRIDIKRAELETIGKVGYVPPQVNRSGYLVDGGEESLFRRAYGYSTRALGPNAMINFGD